MTEEEVEDAIEEAKHVIDTLGMIDFEHFVRFKQNAAYGMRKFGDSFIHQLGLALLRANTKDAVRIIKVWQNEVTQCEMLYRIHLAKENAINETG